MPTAIGLQAWRPHPGPSLSYGKANATEARRDRWPNRAALPARAATTVRYAHASMRAIVEGSGLRNSVGAQRRGEVGVEPVRVNGQDTFRAIALRLRHSVRSSSR